MLARKEIINQIFADIANVELLLPFNFTDGILKGQIALKINKITLKFDVLIGTMYPFQFHDSESILFFNTDLIGYDHVMESGLVCIHTRHSPDLVDKLKLDIESLKQWIINYYISSSSKENYEHIIIPFGLFKGLDYCFLFTEVDQIFNRGDFGIVQYKLLSKGNNGILAVNTMLMTKFITQGSIATCHWSEYYLNDDSNVGVYVFIEDAPVYNRRFIVKNWSDLEALIGADAINYIYQFSKTKQVKLNKLLPLFLGYKIPNEQIHWVCAAMDLDNFPTYGVKIPQSRNYQSRLNNELITWLQTKNCSYDYFFGRGKLSDNLTNSNILIIGLGAIGSIVATSLVRGGVKRISLADYDVKEPENICRSHYSFNTGLNNKVDELTRCLHEISPFVIVTPYKDLSDILKYFVIKSELNLDAHEFFNRYDFVFDCSADNDMAYILDILSVSPKVINLSITNKAKELVCVNNPYLYKWLIEIYNSLEHDSEDMFNPTGCWSPTFKASYNDISTLVQLAIKQINHSLLIGKPLENFYLKNETTDDINIKKVKF